jgi:L-2-hydroxyglutarate oxidase LhgO
MDSRAKKVRELGYDWVGPHKWLSRDELREMEPNVTKEAIGGSMSPASQSSIP